MAEEKRGLFDYLADPEERHFLMMAINGQISDEERLRYAAHLDTIDPKRAEWLCLEIALHAAATSDSAVHARFIELSRSIPFDFRKLFRRDMLLNCGLARAESPRVRFSFACSEKWELLTPTEDAAVRFCQGCKERVYHCETVRDAESHAKAGHCIAVPNKLAGGAVNLDTSRYVGRPDPVGDWAEMLFPDER